MDNRALSGSWKRQWEERSRDGKPDIELDEACLRAMPAVIPGHTQTQSRNLQGLCFSQHRCLSKVRPCLAPLKSRTPPLQRAWFPICLSAFHGDVPLLKSLHLPTYASHRRLGQCPSWSYRLLADGSLHLFLGLLKEPMAARGHGMSSSLLRSWKLYAKASPCLL